MVKLNHLLWPSARTPAAPDTIADVVNMLNAAPRRIGALLDSAVRAAPQTTLATVVSWYPALDLNLLAGMCIGSDSDVQAAWVNISHRAAEIGSWINPREYVPYLDGDGAPILTATMTELIYSSDKDSVGGSHLRKGITSSSSGAYEDSELDGEASASSAHPSSPVAADRDESAVEQP